MKNTRYRTLGLLGSLVLLCLLLAACAASEAEPTEVPSEPGVVSDAKVVIGSSGSNSWLPVRYAAAQGYFQDAGLPNAEYTQVGSASDAAAALAAGELHFAGLAFERAALATLAGKPTVCVAAVANTPPTSVVVAADSDAVAGDWTTLAGKTLGVVQGGWSEILPKYMLQQAGVDLNEVGFTNTPNRAAMIAALETGQVDGISGIEPTQRLVIHDGMAKMFFDLENAENVEASWPTPFLATCLQATKEYAESNPETVAAVFSAFQRALKEFHSNPTIAIDMAADAAPDVDRAVWEASVGALLVTWSETGEISEEAVANVQDLLIDFGTLSEAIPYEEIVFPSW